MRNVSVIFFNAKGYHRMTWVRKDLGKSSSAISH